MGRCNENEISCIGEKHYTIIPDNKLYFRKFDVVVGKANDMKENIKKAGLYVNRQPCLSFIVSYPAIC
jgi:hypothetical protein